MVIASVIIILVAVAFGVGFFVGANNGTKVKATLQADLAKISTTSSTLVADVQALKAKYL
jgi:outer membrane murein-binding lipoprotein Lpp